MEGPLNLLLEKLTAKPAFPGAALAVYRQSDGFSQVVTAGNLSNNHPFFIASATKLYITAILLQLAEQGHLALDDLITKYLPATETAHLHRFGGQDYSASLTIRHLMAHTSGLPDYFQQKTEGKSLLGRLQSGEDVAWTYEDTLGWTKDMPSKFAPGTGRRALYSDSNFQLLGRIIELIEDAEIGEVLKNRIFEPLGLSKTYLYLRESDETPRILTYKKAPFHIRKAMTSFGADGGIVSTAPEMMVFLRAFFEGGLFDIGVLPGLYDWRRVMFPLQYGTGIMLFETPWLFSPLKKQPDMIGHSGLSGAFMFYAPENGIYLAGSVNQVNHPGASFQLMLKAVALL